MIKDECRIRKGHAPLQLNQNQQLTWYSLAFGRASVLASLRLFPPSARLPCGGVRAWRGDVYTTTPNCPTKTRRVVCRPQNGPE